MNWTEVIKGMKARHAKFVKVNGWLKSVVTINRPARRVHILFIGDEELSIQAFMIRVTPIRTEFEESATELGFRIVPFEQVCELGEEIYMETPKESKMTTWR